MRDFYLYLPVVLIVASVATAIYSVMFSGEFKVDKSALGPFLIVSVGAYVYFIKNSHGYNHMPLSTIMLHAFVIYAMTFLVILLSRRNRVSKVLVLPFAMLGGVISVLTAACSFIGLVIIYLLLGIVKDS